MSGAGRAKPRPADIGDDRPSSTWRRRTTDLGVRFFSSASNELRVRRPTDAVVLLGSVLTLGLVSLVAPGPTYLGGVFERFLAALPGLFGWFWEMAVALLVLWPAILVGGAVIGRGRLTLLREQAMAVVFVLVGAAVLAPSWSDVVEGLVGRDPVLIYPAVRLAFATAVIATTSPHLGRPFRRTGGIVLIVGALASIALGSARPVGVIAGTALGFAAAATIHLVFGSPGGRPTLGEVASALGTLGVPAAGLRPAELQPGGVALIWAETRAGRRLLVKVYGRDAWDGQLLGSVWSYLWYRDRSPDLLVGRRQQVEHEAFLTLLAERRGVPVLPVVAAGMANKDGVLALEWAGVPLGMAEGTHVTDEVLRSAWRAVATMAEAGVAHCALDADHILVLPDGAIRLVDLRAAVAGAPRALLQADRAQLLVTTALIAGPDRAVEVAIGQLGADGLSELLPYLQPAALTAGSRRAVRQGPDRDLSSLRTLAARAAGTQPPALEPLRRVTWASLLQAALLAFGVWFLVSAIAGLGLSSIVEELENASWAWLGGALLLAQLEMVSQGLSTIGASPKPLRLGPAILLQYAIAFLAVAVPSSAARVALNIRFFQRTGLPAAAALAVGVVDSFTGFLVEVFIIFLFVLTGGLAELHLERSGNGGRLVILLLAVGGVVVIGIAVAVPRLRRMLKDRLAEARETLSVLRQPTKLAQLFGGNLAARIALAVVLSACLHAFGQQAPLGELLVVNTAVTLFAGLMPVPGGLGVYEGALTSGLVVIGIPDAAALAAALTYRMVTFYLPPIWGWFAMRTLKREGYL
jgi:uncharacterized membrane protein YbhN (UPF0104 family)